MALLSHAFAVSTAAADATTSAIDTTGATLFVAGLSNIVNFIQASSITDSAGNTWTLGTLFTGSSSRYAAMAYVVNPTTSGTHTFSFLAVNGAFFPFIGVAAFTNTPAGAFIAEAAGAEATSGTTVQAGSVSPGANANNLIVAFASGDEYAPISINGGFTTTDTVGKVAGTTAGGGLAYLIQTSATSQNPTWTFGSTDVTVMAGAMAFKENGGGGGGGTATIGNPSMTVMGVQ